MATETQQAPVLNHDGDPIVRDRLYIGGEWVEPSGDGVLEVVDSTTEQVMGRVPEGTAADVDRAVAAARAARTARSTSSGVPSGTRPMTSSVDGLTTSIVASELGSVHSPPM